MNRQSQIRVIRNNNFRPLIRSTIQKNANKSLCSFDKKKVCWYTTSFPLFSSFQPPAPPVSKGKSVYPDIDLQSMKPTEISLQRNQDPNAVYVVTGASRGIGLQYVKSLQLRTTGRILACCRNVDSATNLQQFLSTLPPSEKNRVDLVQLDLEDVESINRLASYIKETYNRVDVLLNVAGILGDGGLSTPGPERSLSKIDPSWMETSYKINLMGPVLMSQALTPCLKIARTPSHRKDGGSNDGEAQKRLKSIIVNLSARVGSISDNELGGWYSYRISKAGLNQATRTMAHELKRYGILTLALHPGTTDTDLSKPFQRNVKEGRLFPVEFTVSRLLEVMERIEDQHSGGLYDWSGKALPF